MATNSRMPVQYLKRNMTLKLFGYGSYSEYLKSDDWRRIRDRVLSNSPRCVMCEEPSQVVHHVRYSEAVLLGVLDSRLAPLCNMCHEMIEVGSDGCKRTLPQANVELFHWARQNKTGTAWCERYYSESALAHIYDKKATSIAGYKDAVIANGAKAKRDLHVRSR